MLRLLKPLAPALDILLPPTCSAGGTGEVTLNLSEEARLQIAALSLQPYCHHCGLSVGPYESHDAANPCSRCGTRDVGVHHLARVGTFSEPLITLVHRLKFSRAWEIAPLLAPFLYQAMLRVSEATRTPIDLLLPIPLHWTRRLSRGFNQSEEIAREVSALSGWKLSTLLKRPRHTAAQARTPSPTHRRENLRGAFTIPLPNPKKLLNPLHPLANKHLWLLDDVSTTGATLHAAASALRKLPRGHRPASINAAVICITDNQAPPLHTP